MATDTDTKCRTWRYWARIGAVTVAASIVVMLGFSGVTWRTPWRQVGEALGIALLFSSIIAPMLAVVMPRVARAVACRFRFPFDWLVLVAIKPVLERFRSAFVGKSSPVHFFWGSFDLAVTRFSGRPAPARPGADAMTREAYSHEVISHGFWPGSGPIQEAAFYAYAAPEPAGLKTAAVEPRAAAYNMELSEFILPYDAVRTAKSPENDLTAFLESTYTAAADRAQWNRAELERKGMAV